MSEEEEGIEAAIYRPDGPLVAIVHLDMGAQQFRLKKLIGDAPGQGDPVLIRTNPASQEIGMTMWITGVSGASDQDRVFFYGESR